MTFTSPQDRARAAAPTSSLMQTPAHLEALVLKDLKPFGWQRHVEDMKRLKALEQERKRREKLAKVERLMKQVPEREASKLSEKQDLSYLFHPFRMKRLISVFCRVADVKYKCVISKSRVRKLATNRQILMWILYKNTDQSLPSIGRQLGDRDHSTILHGINKVSNTPSILSVAEELEKSVLWFEHETYGLNEGAGNEKPK